MTAALELAPEWTAGWYRLGEWQEQAGRTEDAAAQPSGANGRSTRMRDAVGSKKASR